MTDLPYKLTDFVTATEDGLRVADYELKRLLLVRVRSGLHRSVNDDVVDWRNIKECLRYREGEPWCVVWHERSQETGPDVIACASPNDTVTNPEKAALLHRLAAILCDDADAFRVLHNCIEEYGDE